MSAVLKFPVYDDRLSRELGEESQASYMDADAFEAWAIRHNYVGAEMVDRGSTQIGIAYSEQRIDVIGRGSSEEGDWFENFLCWRVPWADVIEEGEIHFGFRVQLGRAAEELRDRVRRLHVRYRRAKWYVTGHSLGAGIGPGIVRLIAKEGVRPERVYLFNMPRAFDRRAAEAYDAEYGAITFRVVVVREGVEDLVPRLPPSRWGYWHVGRVVLICVGKDGEISVFQSREAWERHRRANPLEEISRFRIFTRGTRGVQAHLAAGMVDVLRARERSVLAAATLPA